MNDDAPTYEQQTADFVIETAEPQVETPKEKTPDAEKPKDAVAEAPAAEAGATEDDANEADAKKPVGDEGESDAGGDEATTVKKPNKLSGAERVRQINEATRLMREAERSVAAREAAVAAREASLAKGGLTDKTPDTTVSEGDAPPDPAKFEYGELDGRYIEAKIAHGVTKALKAKDAEVETKRQADAAAVRQQEMQQAYSAFEEAGTKKYDDFNEVVVESAKSGLFKPTPVLAELILTSPEGPDVAYHLASNLKEAREIAGKSPLEQAAWFGRTAATFSPKPSGAAAKVVKTTQAPPPPKSSAKGAGVNPGFDPATADFSSFEAEVMRKK